MVEAEEVICSNCGALCIKTTERRINIKGQFNKWLKNQDGSDHRCIHLTHKDRGANIAHSSNKGMPCWNKCGKFIIRDESLSDIKRDNQKYPEPKLREVVKRLTADGKSVDDLDHGPHHTRYRCMMLKDGYADAIVEMMERDYYEKHAWYLASLASMFNPPQANIDTMNKELEKYGRR